MIVIVSFLTLDMYDSCRYFRNFISLVLSYKLCKADDI